MNDINVQETPWLAPYERSFVPVDLVIKNWKDVEPVYQRLLDAPINNVSDLEAWLINWSEVRGCIDQFATGRYVDMTCHTDDDNKKNAYLEVVRDFYPEVTRFEDKLNRKFTGSPYRNDLPDKRYRQLDREISVSVDLFVEKNIPLQVKLQELSQKYQEISGSLMVNFDGQERTMQQMAVYMRSNERSVRENAYRATFARRLKEADKLESILSEMIALRHQYALNLDLNDYREYAFKSKLRDYTSDDCLAFHDAIEKCAVPLARKLTKQRAADMGLETVAPWDTACDPTGKPPLKPFTTADELFTGVTKVFDGVDGRLGKMFGSIGFSMDLESRRGKAPGGYQTTFGESRIPFIFTNAVGLQDDVNTLIHEGGHSFHTLQCRDQSLIWYRGAGMEFSEVASMSMELLGGQRLSAFYSDEESIKRARRERFESIIGLFGWVAQIDVFQHWLYTNHAHTVEERGAKWLELSQKFDPGLDWSDTPEEARKYQWHRQLHIFEVPFYYVEYAIAQMGALQVYRNYKSNPQKSVDDYLSALALGGSRPMAELFATAGIRFDFSPELLGELMDMVSDELGL